MFPIMFFLFVIVAGLTCFGFINNGPSLRVVCGVIAFTFLGLTANFILIGSA